MLIDRKRKSLIATAVGVASIQIWYLSQCERMYMLTACSSVSPAPDARLRLWWGVRENCGGERREGRRGGGREEGGGRR